MGILETMIMSKIDPGNIIVFFVGILPNKVVTW